MKNAKRDSADYATLFLARAILEGDLAKARAAVEAGADLGASWIDGATKLRDLPGKRGAKAIDAYFRKLLAPETTRELPHWEPARRDPEQLRFWSREFVLFAARRGYDFHARSALQSGRSGVDLAPLRSAKGAARSIESKWSRVQSVKVRDCKMKDGHDGSVWTLLFDATWDRKDHRKSGSELSFAVDETGWALWEGFNAVDESARHRWPDPMDPALDRQKRWEGWELMDKLTMESSYTIDTLVSAISKGGNPFFEFDRKMIGQFSEDSPEIQSFMNRVREVCGPELGFHRRLAPFLTEAGLLALRSDGDLESSTPDAKAPRKTLAQGRPGAL